jgi:hypothetical protein
MCEVERERGERGGGGERRRRERGERGGGERRRRERGESMIIKLRKSHSSQVARQH